MERSDKSTVRDAHSSALEASLNSDVHRRTCVWRPARQAIQFLEDPESCHGPHFNVIHVHFKWDWDGAHNSCALKVAASIWLGLRLLLISFFLGLSNRSGMLVGKAAMALIQLRVCLTLFQHPLLRKSIFFIAWWPSGTQLHGFAGKSPRNSSILFPAINLLGSNTSLDSWGISSSCTKQSVRTCDGQSPTVPSTVKGKVLILWNGVTLFWTKPHLIFDKPQIGKSENIHNFCRSV